MNWFILDNFTIRSIDNDIDFRIIFPRDVLWSTVFAVYIFLSIECRLLNQDLGGFLVDSSGWEVLLKYVLLNWPFRKQHPVPPERYFILSMVIMIPTFYSSLIRIKANYFKDSEERESEFCCLLSKGRK